ncbi:hypothetical protein GRF29_96g1608474 [Pseudopithomyces chartarum]|uniref:DSBA-like thioredoxin domain-containing protein n=1 Tax=Pseudopithomyces chartarum TaxID=1892770 RepID=A0AAN6RHB3_9PLEO|nr:hypothetical protein GRF29_96g1608474 [Pseudopithomyces chartarum]
MTHFTIDIISDTVCPWCYIGKKRLETAISTFRAAHPSSPHTFTTTWRPFYLNPDAPKTSIDKTAFYVSKFGEQRAAAAFQMLAQLGRNEGIDFKFGGRTGNTRDSHRLVQLGKVKGAGVQTRVIEELFEAYFEKEKDITKQEVLLQAAVKAGLEEKEAKEWLESGKGGEEVDREVQEAYERDVHGVPHFTINGRWEVGGAQEAGAFVELFERIGREGGGGVVEGGSKC